MSGRGPGQIRPVYLKKDGGWQWRLGWFCNGVMAQMVAEGWCKTRFECYEAVRKARKAALVPKPAKLPPEVARERKRWWCFGRGKSGGLL